MWILIVDEDERRSGEEDVDLFRMLTSLRAELSRKIVAKIESCLIENQAVPNESELFGRNRLRIRI